MGDERETRPSEFAGNGRRTTVPVAAHGGSVTARRSTRGVGVSGAGGHVEAGRFQLVASPVEGAARVQRGAIAGRDMSAAPAEPRIIRRHVGSDRDPDVDMVIYESKPGAPELDHESHALRHELLRLSESPGYVKKYNGGTVDVNWIRAVFATPAKFGPPDGRISESLRECHIHESQATVLAKFVTEQAPAWGAKFWKEVEGQSFVDAIKALAAMAEEPIAKEYAKLILEFDFSGGVAPASLQPSTKEASSGALWNPDKNNAIFVSRAQTNPKEILAAVLFECGNAARQPRFAKVNTDFDNKISTAEQQSKSTTSAIASKGKAALPGLRKDKGEAKARIEIEVDRENQQKYRQAHRVTNARDLCLSLGVPERLLVAFPYEKDRLVPMPPRTEVRNQEARSALWWFKVDTWSPDQQDAVWMATNHNELLGASGALYR